jgi:hypothetical protein
MSTFRTQQNRLMRRLGFTVKPHGYGPQYDGIHWEHKASGAIIALGANERIGAAQIVRCAIASAVEKRLRKLEQTIAAPIVRMRHANEDQCVIRKVARRTKTGGLIAQGTARS